MPAFYHTYLFSIFLPRTKVISPVPKPLGGENEVWRFGDRRGCGKAPNPGTAEPHRLKVQIIRVKDTDQVST